MKNLVYSIPIDTTKVLREQIRRSLRLKSKELPTIRPRARGNFSRKSYGSFTIEASLQDCKYKYRGCKERLAGEELETHQKQCRFRWYRCEGRKFAGWDCKWKGYYEDVMHHFKKIHPERTYMKVENVIDMSVSFDSDSYDIELIRKRNRLFWFKHRLLSEERAAYWVCQYVGPQDEAVSYCYEVVISDDVRKFAVTELCHTDAVDANEIYESGKCVVVTFDQMKSLMTGPGEIQLYFRIKRNVKAKR